MAPREVTIDFEGRPIPATEGEPVAVALLRAGERILARSVKYHRPRGVQCMVEQCASCLVRVDGLPNRFACTTPCADGMTVARQNAFPSASSDLFRAIDWTFPRTFNHHEMLAGVPVASQVMAKVARQLAGLGELPAAPGTAFDAATELEVRTLLVGLGREGSAHLARLEPGDLAIDARTEDALSEGARPESLEPAAVWSNARALGLYLEANGPVILVRRDRRATRVRPQRVVIATGSRPQLPPFPGSDLPGVMTDFAVERILEHGVLPGRRALVIGESARAAHVAAALRKAGAAVSEPPPGARVVRATGRHSLRGAILEEPGRATTWRGDLLAVAGAKAPAFELAAQAGAELTFLPDRGFAIRADSQGRTSVPWLLAFGSCSAR